ncbi:MAG TPA: sigma-70 family RNA polymerase sigma factor [Xanthobacteraceae bacterium]|nr:sigma-70 family RNA polymerase sigma factor [Xanthobacteraceae bacterium]
MLSPNNCARNALARNELARQGLRFSKPLKDLSRSGASQDTVLQDTILLKRTAAGDQLAMKALFVRHRDRVFRFVLRLVNNEDLAEEILIETFFEVWRSAKRFEERSTFSTWLLAIARHKALTALGRLTSVELDDQMIADMPDLADDPEMALHAKSLNEVVRDCLRKLSAKHTEVIDLVYYHGKTITETAQILRVPEATVKTRMFYARQKLAHLVCARLRGSSPWVS